MKAMSRLADLLIILGGVFHFPFPTATAMMGRAAGVPHERAQPVAAGSSFLRAMEPVGYD